MKKLLLAILLIPSSLNAATYYVATTGGGSTCSEASPCTMDGALTKVGTESGHTIIVEDGTYTASTQDINISGKTFNPRLTIKARNDGGWIMTGYAQAITIDASVGIDIEGGTIKNGSSSHSIYITDSSSGSIKRFGVKNGAAWTAQYGNVIELSSLDDVTGTDDWVLEDVWVTGAMRYGIMIGGTAGYSERNVLRRCVVRFDGSNSPEPHAGISNYGDSGSFQGGPGGARNNLVINCITIDFNSADNASGEGVYAGFYNPHSAVNVDFYGCISFKSKERGWLFFEDAGSSGSDVFNSLAHHSNNGSNEGMVGQRGTGVFNVNQVTISSCSKGLAIYTSGSISSSKSLFMANPNDNDGSETDDHFWNQNTEGSNPLGTDPKTKYYLRIETDGPGYGNGHSTRRGADLTCRYGLSSGSIYADVNTTSHSAILLWPFPYQDRIHALFGEADTGSWATDMSGNDEDRGFAAVGQTLTKYLWEAFGNTMPTFAGDQNCNFTPISASFTGSTASSFTVRVTSVGAVQYVMVMDDNSDFSSITSSASQLGIDVTYAGLNEGTTYYFKAKESLGNDACAYTVAISTCWVPTPPAPLATPRRPSGFKGYRSKLPDGHNETSYFERRMV